MFFSRASSRWKSHFRWVRWRGPFGARQSLGFPSPSIDDFMGKQVLRSKENNLIIQFWMSYSKGKDSRSFKTRYFCVLQCFCFYYDFYNFYDFYDFYDFIFIFMTFIFMILFLFLIFVVDFFYPRRHRLFCTHPFLFQM